MSGKTGPPSEPVPRGLTRRTAVSGLMATLIVPSAISKAWGSARNRAWFKAAQALPLISRSGHTSTALPGGMVLVTGGVHLGALNSAQLYDPGTGSWLSVASMSSARVDHAAALLPDGKVLVCGGSNSATSSKLSSIMASAEVYDPTTNTWSPAPPMNTPRLAHSAAAVAGGVLVTGGIYHSPLGAPELFNGQGWVHL